MSETIVFIPNGLTGTLYATANVVNSNVYVKSDGSFEAFNSDNWSEYTITLSVGPDSLYYGQLPDSTPIGAYAVRVYQQANDEPTYGDEDVGDSIAVVDGPGSSVSGINWVSLAEYKLANAITDNSSDDRIVYFLGLASAACAAYLDRNLLSQSYARNYRYGGEYIDLGEWPVTAVTSIKIGGISQDLTDVWIENLTQLHAPYWLNGNVEVQFTAGYTSLPLELKACVLSAVQVQMQLSDPNVLVSSKSDKNVAVQWGKSIFDFANDPLFATTRSLLDKYKRKWII